MKTLRPVRLACQLLVTATLAHLAVAAEPAAPTGSPIGAAGPYLQPASITVARIAPAGERVGFLALKDERHYAFALWEAGGSPPRPIVQLERQSIINFWWKTDDLILMLVEDNNKERHFASYDFKTSSFTPLDVTNADMLFLSTLPDHASEMLFASQALRSNDLIRIDVRTGRTRIVERDPARVSEWFVDRDGRAIGALELTGDEWIIWWRAQQEDSWKALRQPRDRELPDVLPVGVAPDQRRLLAVDFSKETSVDTVYFDPATGAKEVIYSSASMPTLEAWGVREEAGVLKYAGDPATLKSLIPDAERVLRGLQRTLPGLSLKLVSFSQDTSRMIVLAESDRLTGEFFVFDQRDGSMVRVGSRYADIPRARSSPRRSFTFTASDGLPITGVVTLPEGKAKPPLILYLDSDFVAQRESSDQVIRYLASQGYAVAQVNERGTYGLSRKHREAGVLQADNGIPDDFAEAAKWLDSQGLVNGQKTVVLGTEGKAASAIALAARPGVAKAVVLMDGILDFTPIPFDSLERSLRSRDALSKLAGGINWLTGYRKRIDPSETASNLAVPLFYYSSENRVSGSRIKTTRAYSLASMPEMLVVPMSSVPSPEQGNYSLADSLFSHLKRKPYAFELYDSSSFFKETGVDATNPVAWRLEARSWEKVVEFLRRVGIE